MKTDFMFLTETWTDKEINIPGFKAFVSDPTTPRTDRSSRMSGGVTLLVKLKYKNMFQLRKNLKITFGVKSLKTFSTIIDLFLCGAYIPPEKSLYFDQDIFDEK
jgi:hypothetical protein